MRSPPRTTIVFLFAAKEEEVDDSAPSLVEGSVKMEWFERDESQES